MGYSGTTADAQGQYMFNELNGGTPPMSGTMSGTAGPETAVVITGEINAAVGHTLAINGSTVASNTSTATIASNSGNANYTSYLGTGNGLADQGFFNGDIGEVIILLPP